MIEWVFIGLAYGLSLLCIGMLAWWIWMECKYKEQEND